MPHEDVFFYFRAGESVTLVVGMVKFFDVDGEFLSRTFPDADNHLFGKSQVDVTNTPGSTDFLEIGYDSSHFFQADVRSFFSRGLLRFSSSALFYIVFFVVHYCFSFS